MSDHRIDQKFIDMIVLAKREDRLTIVKRGDGALVKFKYLQTAMEMHLGESNWKIVQDALKEISN